MTDKDDKKVKPEDILGALDNLDKSWGEKKEPAEPEEDDPWA